jgi:hypothetical protein
MEVNVSSNCINKPKLVGLDSYSMSAHREAPKREVANSRLKKAPIFTNSQLPILTKKSSLSMENNNTDVSSATGKTEEPESKVDPVYLEFERKYLDLKSDYKSVCRLAWISVFTWLLVFLIFITMHLQSLVVLHNLIYDSTAPVINFLGAKILGRNTPYLDPGEFQCYWVYNY